MELNIWARPSLREVWEEEPCWVALCFSALRNNSAVNICSPSFPSSSNPGIHRHSQPPWADGETEAAITSPEERSPEQSPHPKHPSLQLIARVPQTQLGEPLSPGNVTPIFGLGGAIPKPGGAAGPGSYSRQARLGQDTEGTQRSEEPVSKTTVKSWGGVPMEMVP